MASCGGSGIAGQFLVSRLIVTEWQLAFCADLFWRAFWFVFALDGEQLHFEYQRGVRTDVLAGAAVPVGEISGKEQLPF